MPKGKESAMGMVAISAAGHADFSAAFEITSGVNTLPPIKLAAEEVVILEKFVVPKNTEGAAKKFSDKSGTEALTETISGTALNTPSAQSSSDLLKNTSRVMRGVANG